MLEEMLKELMDEIGDDIDTSQFTFQIDPEHECIWVTLWSSDGEIALEKYRLGFTYERVPLEQ